MSKRPMRNDPGLGRVGVPAVTGAQDRLSCAEGNGAAVDFRGDVTRSEGVVWGMSSPALGEDSFRRRCAETARRYRRCRVSQSPTWSATASTTRAATAEATALSPRRLNYLMHLFSF